MATLKFKMTIEKAEAIISACSCEIENHEGIDNIGIYQDIINELNIWITAQPK
jgi:hypothetical protein